ncbi:MAG: DUF4097 family beta strand repeat-containing protein [Bdellovibrionota bacterium]
MKSIIIKLVIGTTACFFLSFLTATIGGANSRSPYPRSLMEKYAQNIKEGTPSAYQKDFTEELEDLEIQTTNTDLDIVMGSKGVHANLKGTFAGKAEESFSSEIQGKKLIIRIDETKGQNGFHFNLNGEGNSLALNIPPTISRILFKTVSGDVKAAHLKVKVLEAETTSGDLTVENSDLSGLHFRTVSGDLRCRECKIDDFEGKSVSGDISLELSKMDPKIEAHTTSGDIEIRFAKKPDVKLTFSAVSGELALDPAYGKAQEDSHSVEMVLGKGQGSIATHTVSGDVKIGKL